jgi:predicted alpha/beta-hydrolase family hydrolase
VSEPFGGLNSRWEPAGQPVGLALVLPGRAYSPHAPLLEYVRQALLGAGWTVQQVWWDLPTKVADPDAWVRGEAEEALAGESPPPERLLICGKSLGTRAAAYAAELGAEAIWLTPLLVEPSLVDGIRANPARQLLVGGTADELWDADVAADLAASSGCDVLQVDGADHSMGMPGDPVRSAEILVDVTRAMVRFLAG